jgi:hypothetical protein
MMGELIAPRPLPSVIVPIAESVLLTGRALIVYVLPLVIVTVCPGAPLEPVGPMEPGGPGWPAWFHVRTISGGGPPPGLVVVLHVWPAPLSMIRTLGPFVTGTV